MTNRKTYTDQRAAVRGAKQLGLDPAALDFVQRGERWTWASKAEVTDDVPEVQANQIEDEDDAEWQRKAAEADAVGREEAARTAEAQRIAAQHASDAAAFETVRITPETRQPPEPAAPLIAAPVTAPAAAPASTTPTTLRPDGLRAGTKLALLADTICRPAGATHEELCQVVGWSACLPMAMKACATAEISLRKEKEGRLTRYFGTPKAR